ncbi:PAS domain S-box protein [Ancylomarina longa]|uniref:histidine kinase n=1 Tax=Ancylomarina longa TaxID=2487017 RepID=A0A434AXM1_9BACT|nr:PAS domain S-box protein [Ancylomarina longa]RUT79303.1 PAS domain S-box protein [Ancylomarina longa]
MDISILLSLIQNTAILICFSILYEYLWIKKKNSISLKNKICSGLIIGGIGIVLMISGIKTAPGFVFDTRSVILSISGLFFGAIPTLVAMLVTAIYRISIGGEGLYMGIAVILTSGLIGIYWKKINPRIGDQSQWFDLLLMGLLVHVVMLFSTLLLPQEKILNTLSYLIIPLLTVYPLGNMVLGLFMNKQLENWQNREALFTTEKKYSRLYNSMNDVFIAMDLSTNIVECNAAFRSLMGYSEKEILNFKWKDLTPEIWHKKDDQIIRDQVLVKGSSSVYEKEMICKNGQVVPVELRIHLLMDEPDNPVVLWALVRDISTRKEVIRQIDDERVRLKTLLETVPEMIWLKDRNGIYISCNKNFAEFNSISEDKLIGSSDVQLYNKELADFYYQKDLEVIESKKEIRFVCWAESVTKDKRILTETIKTPMYDADGEIIGVLGVSRDISELKKAEQKLKAALEKAKESDKLKSIFLANMSHEIRTPMNAILGFSELLVDSGLEEVERFQYVNIIQNAGNRLLQIIDDVVDISKLELNQVLVKKSPFNLCAMLQESVEAFKGDDILSNKPQVSLYLEDNKKRRFLNINTDRNRTQQILDNLISNAIKFTNSGRIEVGYSVREVENKSFVQIFVSDQGIGIPKEKQEIIFERFRQGDEDDFIDGTGLGLSISKGLVGLLGGKIWFDSEVGKGSTFYFTIPLSEDEKGKESKSIGRATYENLNQKTILIAENDYNSFLYVKKLFDGENVKIFYAENGVEMMNSFRDTNPDLLIMDVNIPGKDGLECLEELKNRAVDTRIIVQTAFVLKEEEDKCRQAGCHGYLTKPFNKAQLFEEIRKALS